MFNGHGRRSPQPSANKRRQREAATAPPRGPHPCPTRPSTHPLSEKQNGFRVIIIRKQKSGKNPVARAWQRLLAPSHLRQNNAALAACNATKCRQEVVFRHGGHVRELGDLFDEGYNCERELKRALGGGGGVHLPRVLRPKHGQPEERHLQCNQ